MQASISVKPLETGDNKDIFIVDAERVWSVGGIGSLTPVNRCRDHLDTECLPGEETVLTPWRTSGNRNTSTGELNDLWMLTVNQGATYASISLAQMFARLLDRTKRLCDVTDLCRLCLGKYTTMMKHPTLRVSECIPAVVWSMPEVQLTANVCYTRHYTCRRFNWWDCKGSRFEICKAGLPTGNSQAGDNIKVMSHNFLSWKKSHFLLQSFLLAEWESLTLANTYFLSSCYCKS